MAPLVKLAATICAVSFLTGAAAVAQPGCRATEALRALLERDHGERLVAFAATDGGQLLERFENPHSTSWTLIVARADGIACVIASGQGWQELSQQDPQA